MMISRCSKQNDEFDPNKCQIKAYHRHLCTWDEIKSYPNEDEKITKFQYWCKDEEIKIEQESNPNLKVFGECMIYPTYQGEEETNKTLVIKR